MFYLNIAAIMRVSLIICTYKRPRQVMELLQSVEAQTVKPDEVLIVDSSPDDTCTTLVESKSFSFVVRNFHVTEEHRGLTRQRNYGIERVDDRSAIITFLDDDVLLDGRYFENIVKTYETHPDALGVGGYIVNEVTWQYKGPAYRPGLGSYCFEGWVRKEQSRMVVRKLFGLFPDEPGRQPPYSHGLSLGYFPPTGKSYSVDFFMGGVASYRREIFDTIRFSEYFEGYSLYEDLDFTLRLSKTGALYVNTAARVEHHHHPSGRPDFYRYGKMVVRNGWHVWRVHNPRPAAADVVKWWSITWLLIFMRFCNALGGSTGAFKESCGRVSAAFNLFFVSRPS